MCNILPGNAYFAVWMKCLEPETVADLSLMVLVYYYYRTRFMFNGCYKSSIAPIIPNFTLYILAS